MILVASAVYRPLQNVKLPNSALSGERKPHRIFFNINISNFTESSTFIFEKAMKRV